VKIDAVILDVTMPNMGGPTCLEELRNRGVTVPIIMSSGFEKNQSIDSLLVNNASAFIHKPFTIEDIATTLSSLL